MRMRGGRSRASFSARPGSSSTAGVVGRAVGRDAVLVGQDPADPDHRRQLVFGIADSPPGELLRFGDAAAGVHIDRGMPEHPRRKHRDRDKRTVRMEERQHIRRQRHLRDVELTVAQHPEECLLDRKRQAIEVHAFGRHAAFEQRTRTVVVPAGQCQREFRHVDPCCHVGCVAVAPAD